MVARLQCGMKPLQAEGTKSHGHLSQAAHLRPPQQQVTADLGHQDWTGGSEQRHSARTHNPDSRLLTLRALSQNTHPTATAVGGMPVPEGNEGRVTGSLGPQQQLIPALPQILRLLYQGLHPLGILRKAPHAILLSMQSGDLLMKRQGKHTQRSTPIALCGANPYHCSGDNSYQEGLTMSRKGGALR